MRRIQINRYNTKEKWKKVNEDNKKIVKEYMEYASATDKSQATREVYLHNLQLFFVWVMEERDNIFFTELTKRDYMGWLSYLIDKQKLSPSRVRQMRSTISSLSNFCEDILADDGDKRFLNYRNLVLKIPAPALTYVREKTFLSDEQINKLLDWLEKDKNWRECLYVALSFVTGCRKGEIVQFNRSDFTEATLKNGVYTTSIKRGKGRGRAGKPRRFYVPAELIDRYLKPYLAERKDNKDHLFVSKFKGEWKCVSANIFNSWCSKYSEYLGVPVYPHCYRGSIATVLKNRGKDLTNIQTLLDHESIETTAIYVKKDEESDIINLFREEEEPYDV